MANFTCIYLVNVHDAQIRSLERFMMVAYAPVLISKAAAVLLLLAVFGFRHDDKSITFWQQLVGI